MNAQEISALNAQPTQAYTYLFYDDKMFHDIKIKDFQATLYNSGMFFDTNTQILNNFYSSLTGTILNNLKVSDFTTYNLNF